MQDRTGFRRLITTFVVLVCALFLNIGSNGGNGTNTATAAPVVRLRQSQKICEQSRCYYADSYWSGFVVGESLGGQQVIITSAHGFQRDTPVQIIDGNHRATGDVLALDTTADLGLIACRTIEPWLDRAFAVSETPVSQSKGMTIECYGPDGEYRNRSIRLRGTAKIQASGSGRDYSVMLLDLSTQTPAQNYQGGSGGAVLQDGQVVGVIGWQARDNQRELCAVHLPVVEAFLKLHLKCIPRPGRRCEPCRPSRGGSYVPPPPGGEVAPVPVPTPDPRFTTPTTPQTDPAIAASLARIEQRFADLESRIAAIKGEVGPAGATGPQGEKGEKGLKGDTGSQGPAGLNGKDGANGKDGKPAVPLPITVNFEVIDSAGKIIRIDSETFPAGGPIVLRWREQKPPELKSGK